MSFEGIVQIQNENNPTDVNKKLTQGWELLAITPGTEGPMYTLGWRAEKKEPLAGGLLGDSIDSGYEGG